MSKDNQITVNKADLDSLITNSVATQRQLLEHRINGTSAQKHDVYKSAGYPNTITFEEYWKMYTRGGLAKRVVDAFTDDTWVQDPIVKEITDDNAKETKFDDDIKNLNSDMKLWSTLQRFDVVSGVGQYGGLLIGFDDGLAAKLPVTNASNVIYLRPLPEKYVVPNQINNDTTSPRYGKPETYTITVDNKMSIEVHWTRVMHFTWEKLESDFYGVPALQVVFNYMLDLEKIGAASGEGYWKGAYPGLALNADKDANFDDDKIKAIKNQFTDYENELRRNLAIDGAKIEQLKPVVVSPDKQISSITTLTAGATGIPKRMLIGDEKGILAGDQDENRWMKAIKKRQNSLIIPMMIEALIDHLIDVGVLDKVDYAVIFPDPYAPSEEDILKNSKLLIEVINAYLDGSASDILPLVEFLMQIMGYEREAAEKIEKQYFNIIQEEEDDEEGDDDINTNEESFFSRIKNNSLFGKGKK